jgi:hypothetical protein
VGSVVQTPQPDPDDTQIAHLADLRQGNGRVIRASIAHHICNQRNLDLRNPPQTGTNGFSQPLQLQAALDEIRR